MSAELWQTCIPVWRLAMELVKSKIIGTVTAKQRADLSWLKQCFWLTVHKPNNYTKCGFTFWKEGIERLENKLWQTFCKFSQLFKEKTKCPEHLTAFCGYSSVLLLFLSNHTIMKWFGLEGTLDINKFQPTCPGHRCHPLDWVAQCPSHPVLEHFQEWVIHNCSGQPVTVPQYSLSK